MYNSPNFISFVGAFFGAAFAFIFLQLSVFLDSRRKRHKAHYNTLIALSHSLNALLDDVSNHMVMLKELALICKSVKPPNINLTFCFPPSINFNETSLINLANLDLQNDLMTFSNKVKRVDRDTSAIRETYVATLGYVMSKQISPNAYQVLCNDLAGTCTEIASFSEQLRQSTIDIIAKVRVRIERDQPLSHRYMGHSVKKFYEPDFDETVRKEKDVLMQEIQAGYEYSQEYIYSVTNKKQSQ